MQYLGVDPRKEYLKQKVMTASQVELVAMLYEACVRNIRIAVISYNENKDICSASNYLIKAQRIITELMNCLDMSVDISTQLLSLYEFMLNELIRANVEKDMGRTEPVISMLESMYETWHELAQRQRQSMATGS